jgi:Uma2 family endonuclease
MSSNPSKLLTPEEYLAQERKSERRNEYLAGEVFAMVGASRRHNRIVTNLVATIDNQLRARSCNVYSSDMRVKVSTTGLYTYPDVVVTCGDEHFEDPHQDTMLNPIVIIEVLSESTEAYDRGEKFEHYQQVESLCEYLLVAQDKCRVEHFLKQGPNQWIYSEAHAMEDNVPLNSISCVLGLKEIYAKVSMG